MAAHAKWGYWHYTFYYDLVGRLCQPLVMLVMICWWVGVCTYGQQATPELGDILSTVEAFYPGELVPGHAFTDLLAHSLSYLLSSSTMATRNIPTCCQTTSLRGPHCTPLCCCPSEKRGWRRNRVRHWILKHLQSPDIGKKWDLVYSGCCLLVLSKIVFWLADKVLIVAGSVSLAFLDTLSQYVCYSVTLHAWSVIHCMVNIAQLLADSRLAHECPQANTTPRSPNSSSLAPKFIPTKAQAPTPSPGPATNVELQDLTQKFNELVTAEFQQSRNCTLGMKTPVLVNDYLNVLKQRTCAHDAIVSSGRHADILTTRAMLRDCDKTDTPFPAAATRMVQRAAVGSTPDNGAEPRCPKRPRLSLPIEEIHHVASPAVSRAGDAQTDQVTMGKARKTQHCGACKQPRFGNTQHTRDGYCRNSSLWGSRSVCAHCGACRSKVHGHDLRTGWCPTKQAYVDVPS
jgi:hypothetical protein